MSVCLSLSVCLSVDSPYLHHSIDSFGKHWFGLVIIKEKFSEASLVFILTCVYLSLCICICVCLS